MNREFQQSSGKTGEKKQTPSWTIRYTDIQKKALALLGGPTENVMLFGGSRSGKTFIICVSIMLAAFRFPGLRIAVLRRYIKDVHQSILMDTFPKVLDLRFGIGSREYANMFCKTDLLFRTPDGSEVWFGGLENDGRSEKILGREFGLIYFNEVSQIPWESIQIAKTRLSMKIPDWRNRCYYDCNPTEKKHWVYRTFIEKLNEDRTPLLFPDEYVALQMNPVDNSDNISETYLQRTLAAMKGNMRRRFLCGEWTEAREGALWNQVTMIDPYRLASVPENLERIVVAVDPAVTSHQTSDHTGIVVAGRKMYDGTDHFYVLADRSLIARPVEWARQVVAAFEYYRANQVVAEVNQGGELVTTILKSLDISLPVRAVHAGRDKLCRAEPIVALYEQGLVHHIGEFPALEAEMCSYTGIETEKSPDRMDALVWAITDLKTKGTLDIGRFRIV